MLPVDKKKRKKKYIKEKNTQQSRWVVETDEAMS
jgi:hypothetical protein